MSRYFREKDRNALSSVLRPLLLSCALLLESGFPLWSQIETAHLSDCSVTLAGVQVQVNGLDNKNLICPYKDEGNDTGIKCAIDAPFGPAREPGSGEMGDVTRLPEGQLEVMFFEPETYQLCRDIFNQGQFLAAMKRIRPASLEKVREAFSYGGKRFDRTQRAMATVFLSIRSWNYCHREVRYPPFIYNGSFDARDRTIVLYATACEAPSIYYDDIRYLDAGHKFYLIAGHELGHVIDDQAGHIKSNPKFTDENMATVYGTYLAECFSRTFQQILARYPEDYPEEPETPMMRTARECQIKNWKILEQSLAELRRKEKTADSIPYAGAAACVSIDSMQLPVLP